MVLSLTSVMARIEPVLADPRSPFLAREAREAIPDPHRSYYSHSHSHYHPKPRYRSGGIPKEKVALIAGIGIGLIKAGLLSSILNNGK